MKKIIIAALLCLTASLARANMFNGGSSGAVFPVSSGTVNGPFNVYGTLSLSATAGYTIAADVPNQDLSLCANNGCLYNQNGNFLLTSGANIYFLSGGFGTSSDVGINRSNAGTLRINNGSSSRGSIDVGTMTIVAPTTASYDLTIATSTTSYQVAVSTNGHILTNSAPASMGSCGTNPSVVGNDSAGTITTGTGGPTACTLNFASNWGVAPVCTFSDDSTAISGDISAVSATSVTFSFSLGLTSGHIYYQCKCYGPSCL